MRRSRFTAPGVLLVAVLLVLGMTNSAFLPGPVAAMQEATPDVTTPAVIETAPAPTEAPQAAAPAATPDAAAPAPAAQTDVVTMVLWYANSADADILELYPLATDATFVASPAEGATPAGTIDFPEDGSPPVIVIGENSFLTYPRADGVIERWTWLDDFEGARPATLVMQLSGQAGPYQNYYGTATMMSRDEGGAGGVLVVALRPPAPEAVAEQEAAAEVPAEEAVVAEEVPAEDVPVEDVVVVEEAPVEDVIVVEEAPVEEVPAEVPVTDDGVIEVEPAG
jgi:hypothetical protein